MQAATNRVRQSQASKARCPRITELALRLFMEFYYARPKAANREIVTSLDPKMMTALVNHLNTNCKLPKTHLV